jgi:uncharacterized membrane protein YhaH (DUF805 family)
MTIGQWLSFQGRIGRKTWWLGYFPLLLAALLAPVLDGAMGFNGVPFRNFMWETCNPLPVPVILNTMMSERIVRNPVRAGRA